MVNNTFFKSYLGIIFVFLCFFITCCTTPTINVTGKIHLNPIAEIFSGLNKNLPDSSSGQSQLSIKQKKSIWRESRKYAKIALRRDKAILNSDLTYEVGKRIVPNYPCKGGICPCQSLQGSNKFIFVEAIDNTFALNKDKFNGMALLINGQRIDLPEANININSKAYRSFILDVSNYQSQPFPNGTKLLIYYQPNNSGYTYQYQFNITYDRNSRDYPDGMVISNYENRIRR